MQAISLIEKVIGKENIENFLKEFKAALTTLPKEGEVKEVLYSTDCVFCSRRHFEIFLV